MDKKLLFYLLGYLTKKQWKDAIKQFPKANDVWKEVCEYYNMSKD